MIDEAVLKALALQAPVAADLREVVAIKMIATDLERVGDLARNIAKSALRLGRRLDAPIPPILARARGVRAGRAAQRARCLQPARIRARRTWCSARTTRSTTRRTR